MSFLSGWFRKARLPHGASPATGVSHSGTDPQHAAPVPERVDGAAQASAKIAEEVELQAALDKADHASMARFALEGTSTQIRQRAAEAIEDPQEIKRLLRELRGRDKNVHKILRQKNDAILARERAKTQRRQELEAASAAIERHAKRGYDPLFVATLEQLSARWKSVADSAPEAMGRRVQQDIELCHETIAHHLKEIAAQAARELAQANAAAEAERLRLQAQSEAAAATALAAAEEKARSEQLANAAQEMQRISGLIGKARGALKEGNSGRAAGLRKAIEEKLVAAPLWPPPILRQLAALDERLNELKDWKSFAAAPKRGALIERMEKLIGCNLPPRELADEIKELQAQWKTLSRGVAEEADEDWQRFHTAAQAAYRPCKEYFAEQARLREQNLQARKALLERLTAFESGQNWEQPDWRLLATVLREARNEWRAASPVDRQAGKASQEEYDAAISRLQTRLDEEHALNIRRKKNLIARAKHFLTATDTRKAVDEIKQLQAKWKEVGFTPRDEDRGLWEEFRKHCDAVFQRDQEKRAAQIAEVRAKKAEEAAERAELDEAARQHGVDSADGGKFAQLQSAFEALGDAKPVRDPSQSI